MTAAEFRAARDKLGLTQHAMAEMLKIRSGHVSGIERGKYHPSKPLAELLRMKLAEAERKG